MELEQQVVSLDLAKRLKELGVNQRSCFLWNSEGFISFRVAPSEKMWDGEYAAFTVAELIQLLGDRFSVLERFKDGCFGAYVPNDIGISAIGKNPADVLAELLEKTYEDREV